MCRRIDKVCEDQTMGELPEGRLKPSPPFYNTSVDLFGPMYVKDVVKKRTQLKVYGVLFNCLASRAIYRDMAEGYDKNSFLKVFRRFVALRGFPKTVYSEEGYNWSPLASSWTACRLQAMKGLLFVKL